MVHHPTNRQNNKMGGRYLKQEDYLIVPALNRRVSGGGGDTVCPVCGLLVKVRKDGLLWRHRVGRSVRDAWPCPGGGDL